MSHTLVVRISRGAAKFYREHPELKPSAIIEEALRKEFDLDPIQKKVTGVVCVTLTDDLFAAIRQECQGKHTDPFRHCRAALERRAHD